MSALIYPRLCCLVVPLSSGQIRKRARGMDEVLIGFFWPREFLASRRYTFLFFFKCIFILIPIEKADIFVDAKFYR